MFELLLSDEFKVTLDSCLPEIRNQAMDTIQRLRVDPGHPGLQAHKIRGATDKWECYVNRYWRILYDWDGDMLRLWKLGDHRIIDRVHRRVFSPQTAFSCLQIDDLDEAEAEAAAGAEVSSSVFTDQPIPEAEANNPFAYFPVTHLRFLGVPSNLVKKVQRAHRLEDLEQRQVAAAARLIEHNTLLRQEREFVEPSWSHRIGARPRVVTCDLPEREVRFVCEEVLYLVGGGRFRLSDFAVLCPTNIMCQQYCDEFTRRNIPNVFHKDHAFNILEENIKVMTIHSSKGIEFPVVFVAGVRRSLIPRYINRSGLDKEESQLDRERFRTLLYVAMTRAAENLFLVTTSGKESPFLSEITGLVDYEEYCGQKN